MNTRRIAAVRPKRVGNRPDSVIIEANERVVTSRGIGSRSTNHCRRTLLVVDAPAGQVDEIIGGVARQGRDLSREVEQLNGGRSETGRAGQHRIEASGRQRQSDIQFSGIVLRGHSDCVRRHSAVERQGSATGQLEFTVLDLKRVIALSGKDREVCQHVRRVKQQGTVANSDGIVGKCSIGSSQVDCHVDNVEQPNTLKTDTTTCAGNQQRIICIGKISVGSERDDVLTVRRLQ